MSILNLIFQSNITNVNMHIGCSQELYIESFYSNRPTNVAA